MMFEQYKIVIFNNIIFMKTHGKIFRKNSMEIFRNFPEKYEIFRTNFPPHITNYHTKTFQIFREFNQEYDFNMLCHFIQLINRYECVNFICQNIDLRNFLDMVTKYASFLHEIIFNIFAKKIAKEFV